MNRTAPADLLQSAPETGVRARWLRAARWTGDLLARLFVVSAALFALGVLIRSPVASVPYLLTLGVPLCAAAALRRDPRDYLCWAGLALGFVLWVHLRAATDELAGAAHFGYAIEMDRVLGLGEAPTVRLQETLGRGGPLVWLAVGIHLSYFVLPPLTASAVWLLDRARFGRFVGATLLAYYLGLVIHLLLPTAPPWMAADQELLPGARHLMGELFYGFDSYQQGVRVSGNDVAAMPSLHTAIAAIAGLAWARLHPWGRRAGALYVVAMGFSLVYLAEHYVVDVLAGLLLAAVAWWAARPARGARL